MGRDQHDDRKRALALGKFKFLYQVYDDTQLIFVSLNLMQLTHAQLRIRGYSVSYNPGGR